MTVEQPQYTAGYSATKRVKQNSNPEDRDTVTSILFKAFRMEIADGQEIKGVWKYWLKSSPSDRK